MTKDSQKISLKLYSIVTHFVNFKHNFLKEIETFFKNKLKWIQEICFKINPPSSELQYHVHNWLIISLKDFCIVIRKWPTFWPSNNLPENGYIFCHLTSHPTNPQYLIIDRVTVSIQFISIIRL